LTCKAHGPAGEGARVSGQRRQAGPGWQREMGQRARTWARGMAPTGRPHRVEREREGERESSRANWAEKVEGEGVLG
jgi:hypothetical protein